MNRKLIESLNIVEWSADPDDPTVSCAVETLGTALGERETLLGACRQFVEELLWHKNQDPPVWFCEWCGAEGPDRDALLHNPECPVGQVLDILKEGCDELANGKAV
jgi:hypothetical protein